MKQNSAPRFPRPDALWVVLAVAVVLVLAQPCAALGEETVIVSGSVSDASTSDPVADAAITATYPLENGGLAVLEARTAADGTYRILGDGTRGALVLEVSVSADGYMTTVHTVEWDGTTTFELDIALERRIVIATRVEGANRYLTAVAASKLAYPDGASAVVVATGANWPDALGGSALAGALDAPILLTGKDALPGEVLAEITRLKGTRASFTAYVLGGTPAISAKIFDAIDAIDGSKGTGITRIWGANRYETADAVAKKTIELLKAKGTWSGTAFIATGANFPDALGASPLAAKQGWPIYLANPAQGDNASLVATMKAHGVSKAILLGGTNVVSDKVKTALGTLYEDRLYGANRYDTAVAVAKWGVANAGLGWNKVAIATGENFPDALAGGVLQGTASSVLLLTPTKELNAGVAAILAVNKASITEVRFLGSASAVSAKVRANVATSVANSLSPLRVFVDAGHGGADPGAVDGTADDGIYTEEKRINLAIALKVQAALASIFHEGFPACPTAPKPTS